MKKLFSEKILILHKKINSNKVKLLWFSLSLVVLLLVSFLIEIYGFGNGQYVTETSGVQVIGNSNVISNGFIDEGGVFVSKAANDALVLPINGKPVRNLEITLAKNSNYGLAVQYIDTKNNQEITLPEKLEKSMQKNELSFMHDLVFNISNSPQSIIILANKAGVAVNSIKIDNNYHFNFYRFLFLFSLGFLMIFFVYFRKNIGKKPEYVFFVLAMTCGTLLAVSEPRSFVSWDEAIHYENADGNSFGNLISNGIKNIYSATNSVPSSYSIKEQANIDNFFDSQAEIYKKHKKSKFNFSLLEFYNQVAYWPSSLAFLMGRISHIPNSWVFTLGRLANIFVYSIIVFFAIRKIKSGKLLMAVIGLLPTAIFLASNYSYDYWVIAFTLLGFAYLFSELQQPEKKITTKEICIILGSFVFGIAPKAIYFPLIFLVFLLKKEKFESQKQYKKFIWASVFSILLVVSSFMLPFIIGGPGKGDHRGGPGVNSAQQVKFILNQPLAYSKILSNFLLEYLNPKNAGGYITFFAYLGSIKGDLVLAVMLIVVALTDKNKMDQNITSLKIKGWVIGIFLTTTALISTALYVAFTAVGNTTILGVQQRYLIPLIFPLLFVMGSSRIKNPINKNIYSLIIFIVIAAVILQGIWEILIVKYY